MADTPKVTKPKSVAKYYYHKEGNQFQAIMSGSPLGKLLAKSDSWKELQRDEFYKMQGLPVPNQF